MVGLAIFGVYVLRRINVTCSNLAFPECEKNPNKKQDKKPEDQVKKDISKLGGFRKKTTAGAVGFGGSGGESDTKREFLLALERCSK